MAMPRIFRNLVLLLGLLLATPAHADLCAVDDAPAGTLLFPHFEVDLGVSPLNTEVTWLWIRNDDSDGRLAHVTLWGDYHRPAFAFPVYLAAGATLRFDLDSVVRSGTLPSSGSGISPVGAFDADGVNPTFPGCNAGSNPANGPPVANQIPPPVLLDLQQRLRGEMSPSSGLCYGQRLQDGIARGFVTVDVVSACSVLLPGEAGYFGAGGVVVNQGANALSGGYLRVDAGNNFAQAGRALALEVAQAGEFGSGDITFFSRLGAGDPGDAREPLPGRWSFAFGDGDNFDGTDLIVWRGVPATSGTACQFTPPTWRPLPVTARVPFDVGGDTPLPGAGSAQPIGLATQRLSSQQIDGSLQGTVAKGSGLLALHASDPAYPDGAEGQAWVGVRRFAEGRFSEQVSGSAMDSFCTPGKAIPANVDGPLLSNPIAPAYVFADNFEDYRSAVP
jgi:hypothetical protein